MINESKDNIINLNEKIVTREKISKNKSKQQVGNKNISEDDSSDIYKISDENRKSNQILIKKKRKMKTNHNDNIQDNQLETIINISEIKSKNADIISNSDMILLILEICLNSNQFNLQGDNSSRTFWEEVGKRQDLNFITKTFKPETLRKYWRTLRRINRPKKIINLVKEYKEKLDSENIKLLSSINIICEYIMNPKKGIDYYINKYAIKCSNKNCIDVKDMNEEEQIEEILKGFEEVFPNKSTEEILDKLYQNNFCIKNTYLVLKDEKNFGYLSFSQSDDEFILSNCTEVDLYREFAFKKGHINILKRKKFLEGK